LEDALGDHAQCCGYKHTRTHRHNRVRDALFDLGRLAKCDASIEVSVGAVGAKMDVFFRSFVHARPMAVDVVVSSPFSGGGAPLHCSRMSPGATVEAAALRKEIKHQRACETQGAAFCGFSVNTFGCLSLSAELLLCQLAGKLARVWRWRTYSQVVEFVRKRIAVAIQAGVADVALRHQSAVAGAQDGDVVDVLPPGPEPFG
jgi:hypothetical protein